MWNSGTRHRDAVLAHQKNQKGRSPHRMPQVRDQQVGLYKHESFRKQHCQSINEQFVQIY